jgi:hypothetical protein
MTSVYSYNYNSDYHPAMPMGELSVGLPLGDMLITLQAIVDSGADATMIPLEHLRQIGARRSRKVMMRGVTGGGELVDLYAVAIQLGSYRQGFLEIVGIADSDETIIGRDILNHLSVTLNGPAAVVEVS